MGMFGFCFLKNILKNTNLVFSENCSFYLNLMFSIFFMFFRKKKLETRDVLCVLLILVLFALGTRNSF